MCFHGVAEIMAPELYRSSFPKFQCLIFSLTHLTPKRDLNLRWYELKLFVTMIFFS